MPEQETVSPTPLSLQPTRLRRAALGPAGALRRAIRSLPFSPAGNRPSYRADVLVAGSNPVLNVLAALSAVRAGRSVLLAQGGDADGWPYAMLDVAAARHLVSVRLGGAKDPGEAAAPLAAWAGAVFGKAAAEMSARGRVVLLPRPFSLDLNNRSTAELAIVEAAVRPSAAPPVQAGTPQGVLASVFRQTVERRLPVLAAAGWSGGRGLSVLADRVVLTSPGTGGVVLEAEASEHESDTLFRPAGPARVSLFGTARRQTGVDRLLLERAIGDLVEADGDDP
jgi:hypothetical protein